MTSAPNQVGMVSRLLGLDDLNRVQRTVNLRTHRPA